MKDLLNKFVLKNGLALFGVADIREIKNEFLLPEEVISDLNYAISIGYRLSQKILDTLIDGPNQIYYFHYQRVNVLLDTVALQIAGIINSEGYKAMPIPASQVVNWENMKASVSHRKIAELAGLGWRGRNNLTVNNQFGSQVRYTTILTDFPFEIELKKQTASCGECKACITVCPADAISDSVENFKKDLCIAKLKEFQKTRNISQMICGMCVKVCRGSLK